MKLRPDEITSILKERIEHYDVETDLAEVGTVLQVGDGIARIYGLENCAIDRVVSVWRRTRSDRVAATYAGVRLHPLLLSRHVWGQTPDLGLRDLPAELVPCDDLSPPGDVDSADEVEEGWPPPVPE